MIYAQVCLKLARWWLKTRYTYFWIGKVSIRGMLAIVYRPIISLPCGHNLFTKWYGLYVDLRMYNCLSINLWEGCYNHWTGFTFFC